MKKVSRNFVSLFMAILLVMSFSITAFASDENVQTEKTDNQIIFDLENKTEQSYTYKDDKGNEITVGIKPANIPGRSSEPWSEGAWNIYLYGPLSAFYDIDISSSGRITNAYNEKYTALGVTVTADSLTHTSTQARYRLTYKIPDPLPDILGSSGSLYARIQGTNLVVTNTIY